MDNVSNVEGSQDLHHDGGADDAANPDLTAFMERADNTIFALLNLALGVLFIALQFALGTAVLWLGGLILRSS